MDHKEKFFAQYWGLDVLIRNPHIVEYSDVIECVSHNWSGWGTACLNLKSTSRMTDDEARVVAIQNRFNGNFDAYPKVGRSILSMAFSENDNNICLPVESADFLRSLGYALPWNGYSIVFMIENGWIKLI